MNIPTLPNLSSYTWHRTGKYPHRYKVYSYKDGMNDKLFSQLRKDGFFDFHTTNEGYLVSEHQIVAFYLCGGYQALQKGYTCPKGKYEIHHINGDTNDNTPSNLMYVDSQSHAHVTKHQRACIKYLKLFARGDSMGLDAPIWNRKGERVHNKAKWLEHLIKVTTILTANFREMPLNLKKLGKWMKKLRANIGVAVDTTFIPTIILAYGGD